MVLMVAKSRLVISLSFSCLGSFSVLLSVSGSSARGCVEHVFFRVWSMCPLVVVVDWGNTYGLL